MKIRFGDYCNIAILQLLIDTVYDKQRAHLKKKKMTLQTFVLRVYGSRVKVLFNCIYYNYYFNCNKAMIIVMYAIIIMNQPYSSLTLQGRLNGSTCHFLSNRAFSSSVNLRIIEWSEEPGISLNRNSNASALSRFEKLSTTYYQKHTENNC